MAVGATKRRFLIGSVLILATVVLYARHAGLKADPLYGHYRDLRKSTLFSSEEKAVNTGKHEHGTPEKEHGKESVQDKGSQGVKKPRRPSKTEKRRGFVKNRPSRAVLSVKTPRGKEKKRHKVKMSGRPTKQLHKRRVGLKQSAEASRRPTKQLYKRRVGLKQSAEALRRLTKQLHKRRLGLKQSAADSVRSNTKKGNAVPKRQGFVKKMIKHAWDSYAKYAWGFNELVPMSRSGTDSQGIFGNAHIGATLVDALDTLYIAGFEDEYKRGRDWVANDLTFDNVPGEVSMFEINIRFMGAFLSMYALTGDELYKKKAIDLGERFAKGFHRSSGVSHNAIRLSGYNANSDFSGPCFVIAEPGTLHLEFVYLSTISGDPKYKQIAERVRDALNSPQMTGLPGLPYAEINTNTGLPCRSDLSLDGGSDSYYEYVVKSYVQSGKKDKRALKLFNSFAKSVHDKMMTTAYADGQQYRVLGRTYPGGGIDPRMGHLACFAGGMFALGAEFSDSPKETLEMGKDITQACREMYARTASKIGPDEVQFNTQQGGPLFSITSDVYLLRPEVVESYFVLWRITKDPKYREWGWEAAKAIEKYCRTDNGYVEVRNVDTTSPSQSGGVQQSFFIAETLKYLYLLFCDDDVLPLDKWVFNTEAHPFPAEGAFKKISNLPISNAKSAV